MNVSCDPAVEIIANGARVWLSARDAKRLSVLARDLDTSMHSALVELIERAFRNRQS